MSVFTYVYLETQIENGEGAHIIMELMQFHYENGFAYSVNKCFNQKIKSAFGILQNYQKSQIIHSNNLGLITCGLY